MKETQRPDFYILNEDDWRGVVVNKEMEYKIKYPDRETKIEKNVLILLSEINKQGKPYMGISVRPKDVEPFKERWDKNSE